MPLLGDIYLDTVYAERPRKSVKTTDHPVEDGNNIVDHIEREPQILDISGICTGPDAALRLNKLKSYADTGRRLNYVYRNFFPNMVIENIDTTHDVEVAGAFKFNISLKQITVSKPSSIAQLLPAQKTQAGSTSNQGRQQTQTKNNSKRKHTVARGESLWKIAQKYYGAGNKYMTIYNANKSVIGSNPDVIKAGQVLIIP